MNRLKELRLSRDLKQFEMADLLGVARPTYTKYESGAIQMSDQTLKRISQVFGVSIDYILCNDVPDVEDDPWTLREDEREDPDRKRLFMLARHGSAQDVRQASAILDALRATNSDFYDGDDPA